MSRETESMIKAFHKYLEENSDENRTEDDIQRLMNDFMAHYNSNIPELVTEDTAETSDDYLELAYNAETIKEAKKYAKKALKLDPHNYDAEIAVIDLSTWDDTRTVRDYAKAVQKATKHMDEEGYFEDDCIGAFWGILETRPYMRLRGRYVQALLQCGMIGQARDECEELLRLCEGDNMGMRYNLMHIYSYFEDEDAAISLHKRFDSYDETEMLLPLSILYYKRGNYAKAKQYLSRLNNANKDLGKFLKIVLGYDDEDFEGFELEGGYRPGTIEEFMMELRNNHFIFINMDAYMEWALDQMSKFK